MPHIRHCAQDIIRKASDTLMAARDGNFLEAINLALTIFDKHYLDRDLIKTGMSIICITPGTGLFTVSGQNAKLLSKSTKRKILDFGVFMQLICLAQPPLHTSPILEIGQGNYHDPYWISTAFYSSPITQCLPPQS